MILYRSKAELGSVFYATISKLAINDLATWYMDQETLTILISILSEDGKIDKSSEHLLGCPIQIIPSTSSSYTPLTIYLKSDKGVEVAIPLISCHYIQKAA